MDTEEYTEDQNISSQINWPDGPDLTIEGDFIISSGGAIYTSLRRVKSDTDGLVSSIENISSYLAQI